MPEISRFFGIIITMYHREHGSPHFHAWYSGSEITVDIASGAVNGEMPARALALVIEWWKHHRAELEDNWQLAQRREPLMKIRPLE
jgi:hypothetical protein